ncbi:hypothetical protein ABH923_003596 [Leifsonia sp. EB41]|uniref:hypothetical protein n=1 Tax=Leifsonia sp. EB41 TaxID=3156260 RepID=UPI0035162F9E
MTDTAPQRTQYDLVPGMTAYRLSAILSKVGIGVYVITGAIGLLWFVLSGATVTGRLIVTVIYVGVSLAWTAASFLLMRRRNAAENAAGYTTRSGVLHGFDQVDPNSGVVIRRAGSAVLTKPARPHAAGSGLSMGAVLNGGSSGGVRFEEPASSTARLRFRILMIVLIVLVAGVPVIVIASHGGDTGSALVMVLLVLGVVAVVLGIVYGGTALRTRQKMSVVAARRPDAFVFLSRRTPELEDALDELLGTHGTLGQSVTVSVGALGVELWRVSADEPRVAIPWSAIGHVHPGRLLVAVNNREFPARTVHIFLGDGARLDAPLPVYGRHGITVAGADRANEVLDAFRRYTTVA